MSANSLTTKLFLYGTVKRGQPNHYMMEEAPGKSRFIGTAVTKDKYPLIIGTQFNIVMLLGKCGLGKQVHGQVFEIDDEKASSMDTIEDYPRTYNKRMILVTIEDSGEEVECLCYMITNYPEHLEQKPHYAEYDMNGDHGRSSDLKSLTEMYEDRTCTKLLYDLMLEDI